MNTLTKRIITSAVFLGTFLSAPLSSVYALPLTLCNKDALQGFSALCTFRATENSLGNVIAVIINILLVIAVVLAIFFLIWGGIQWILSGGDKAKVETARGHIIAAVIGLAVAFLAFFILQIVLRVFGINTENLQLPNVANVLNQQ